MEVTIAETLNLDRGQIKGGIIQCIYVNLKKRMKTLKLKPSFVTDPFDKKWKIRPLTREAGSSSFRCNFLLQIAPPNGEFLKKD